MGAMKADPNYIMPLEDQLKQAQERADAYAEMFEIAGSKVAALKANNAELLEACKAGYEALGRVSRMANLNEINLPANEYAILASYYNEIEAAIATATGSEAA